MQPHYTAQFGTKIWSSVIFAQLKIDAAAAGLYSYYVGTR